MWSRADLVATLKSLGFLRSPQVERALSKVPLERFLPEPLAGLANADLPLPFLLGPNSPTMPSTRCLVSTLEMLEPGADLRTLVVGARGGFAAALSSMIASPRNVVVVEKDETLRRVTAEHLEAADLQEVRVAPCPPEESFDRVLVIDPRAPPLTELVAFLRDSGSLVSRGRGVHDLAFVKITRHGGEAVPMTFTEAPFPVLAGPRNPSHVASVDFGRLLAVEDLLAHVWEGRITGHYDQHFRDVAEETFSGGPLGGPAAGLEANPRKWAARQAFQAAYILQSAGELDRAADVYARSLDLAPSAEAHTFLGWTYSFMGRYDEAIAECQRAIDVDPTFGNPYNDMGAYLIELGRLDDAIPWLEKAVASSRYRCYFYAHTNLARVYLHKRMPEKARRSLLAALRTNPDYAPARELLRHLESGSNYFA
jgi:protein-L-isoaspartate O-methyltransferase